MVRFLKPSLSLSVRLFDAGHKLDSALSRCFMYRSARAVVLDTILGPAEDVEYVSTTTPSSPPPSY